MRQATAFDARPGPGARVTDDGWPFGDADFVDVPIPAFLVEHPEAGPVLIDTGLHPSVAVEPRRSLGTAGAFFMHPKMEAGQALRSQLERRGVDPNAIELVVMTHLHVDHASGVSEFPHATFVADRREWGAAICRENGPSYHRPQFERPLDWRLVDYGHAAVPAEGFARTIDLLGDGSIRLLSTPGHSAGHQSVLVRLRGRDVLIAGDAAFTRRAIDERSMPMYLDDEERFRESLDGIRRWVARNPDGLVIPGHDAAEWARVTRVYD